MKKALFINVLGILLFFNSCKNQETSPSITAPHVPSEEKTKKEEKQTKEEKQEEEEKIAIEKLIAEHIKELESRIDNGDLSQRELERIEKELIVAKIKQPLLQTINASKDFKKHASKNDFNSAKISAEEAKIWADLAAKRLKGVKSFIAAKDAEEAGSAAMHAKNIAIYKNTPERQSENARSMVLLSEEASKKAERALSCFGFQMGGKEKTKEEKEKEEEEKKVKVEERKIKNEEKLKNLEKEEEKIIAREKATAEHIQKLESQKLDENISHKNFNELTIKLEKVKVEAILLNAIKALNKSEKDVLKGDYSSAQSSAYAAYGNARDAFWNLEYIQKKARGGLGEGTNLVEAQKNAKQVQLGAQIAQNLIRKVVTENSRLPYINTKEKEELKEKESENVRLIVFFLESRRKEANKAIGFLGQLFSFGL